MRSPPSGFMYQCNLHAEATFQAGEMHEGSNQHMLHPSPCQNVSHNRRDQLARKTGGPERGARTQSTHGAKRG